MQELPIGDGPFSSGDAIDINDDGHIVAQATVTNFFRGYLITPQGVLDLDAQTGMNVWPVGINNSGVIAANIPRGFSTEVITWSNGVVRYLGYLDPTNGAYALDINNHGDVLASLFVNARPPDASRFTAVFHDGRLSLLGTFYGEALNDRGEIAGESEDLHALFYRAGTAFDLGTLPGDRRAFANAINNSGQIVGYSEGPGERYLAVLYSDGALHELNDLINRNSGWVLSTAHAINERGQIVGFGYYRGQESTFLLTPIGHSPRKHEGAQVPGQKPDPVAGLPLRQK
jgi:probable HAF family extracellular repeat protein